MKSWNVILGVDVSKLTLDICCAERKLYLKIDNKTNGFALLKKWCKANEINLKETLIVLEHTGGYEYRFMQFCDSASIPYCRIPGLEIKNSMGMTRGKSDRADSYRIGLYGEEKMKKLTPSKPVDKNILALKQLLSFRKRLVREKAGYESTARERKYMYTTPKMDAITHIAQTRIRENKKHIRQIEAQIAELIKADESLLTTHRILTSLKGIGNINACMTIAYTENFTSFTDARKYAVYVGVVPFAHGSGTSIKKRDRVSRLAHKEIKQELNQAAKTAVMHDPELRAYATRKLQNKSYPLVLNNVKFKLILRMFALVKRGEAFVENYKKAA
jgi:transposase